MAAPASAELTLPHSTRVETGPLDATTRVRSYTLNGDRNGIVTWIERIYDRRRRQRRLGRLTPIEFELLHHQLATAA